MCRGVENNRTPVLGENDLKVILAGCSPIREAAGKGITMRILLALAPHQPMYLLVMFLCLVIAVMFCKTFFPYKGIWFFLGFLVYPLLFTPLMLWLAPGAMDKWVHLYADYIRLWGV